MNQICLRNPDPPHTGSTVEFYMRHFMSRQNCFKENKNVGKWNFGELLQNYSENEIKLIRHKYTRI